MGSKKKTKSKHSGSKLKPREKDSAPGVESIAHTEATNSVIPLTPPSTSTWNEESESVSPQLQREASGEAKLELATIEAEIEQEMAQQPRSSSPISQPSSPSSGPSSPRYLKAIRRQEVSSRQSEILLTRSEEPAWEQSLIPEDQEIDEDELYEV